MQVWVRNKSAESKAPPYLSVNLFLSLSFQINSTERISYLSGNLTVSLCLSLLLSAPWTAVFLITGGEFELCIDLTNTLCPLELGKMENEADWRKKLWRRCLNFDQRVISRVWQLHDFLFCLSLSSLVPTITINYFSLVNQIKMICLGHNQAENIKWAPYLEVCCLSRSC